MTISHGATSLTTSASAETDRAWRVLHVLDHSLPTYDGYVFRTLGILAAQRARG